MAMQPRTPPRDRKPAIEDKPAWKDYFRAVCLYVPEETNIFEVIARGVIFLVMLVWGLMFVFHSVESDYAASSFLHNVNLAFHEGGHIVFSFFGKFIATLGGSLMQVLIPAIAMFTLLLKTRDPFGASVGLWWVGQNLIDLAPYINDARDLKLILLGGVTGRDVADYHDWEYLLRKTGLLKWDHFLGWSAHIAGSAMIALALAWGGYIIYRQYRNRAA